MSEPLVSVVMPAYNHERYVGEAVTSVLEQTIPDLELVVIDDGSQDRTGEVIQSFSDPRIRYFRQSNQGAHRALNRGLAESRGRYLAIINSDDRFHPTRIARFVEEADQGKQFLLSDINLMDEHSRLVEDPSHWWLRWYEGLKQEFIRADNPMVALLSGNFAITTSNFFFDRECFQRIGPFRPFKYINDYDYAFRAACRLGGGFGFLIGEKLLDYRLHGANTIKANPLKANIETYYFLKQATREVLGPDVAKPLAHLDKIKRYITKLDAARKWAIVDRLHEELARLHQELARLHQELGNSQALAAEYAQARDLAQNQLAALTARHADLERGHAGLLQAHEGLKLAHEQLLDYHGSIMNSRSLAIGLALTAPWRWWQRMNRPRLEPGVVNRVRDVGELRQALQGQLGSRPVVSFDIFDTLLEREVDPPDFVKLVAARRLRDHLAQTGGHLPEVAEILAQRQRIEASLRQRRLDQGLDHECRFSELAEELAHALAGRPAPELAQRIIAEELDAEQAALYPKPGMRELLAWLKQQGRRVIAISDMYLDEEHLRNLLSIKGLDTCLDALYVSSEIGKGKYSGRLFQHVLEAEGIGSGDLLHVGDNHHSDQISPQALGIRAIHLDDTRSNRRRLLLRGYAWLTARNPYWRGRHLMQLIRPPASQDPHYDFGFSFLGPVYATFLLGVIEQIREQRIPRVFFLAREGYLFLELFKLLAPGLLDPERMPETRYLYVSRKSTAPAAIHRGLDYETVLAPLHNPKQRGLYSICRTFDLPPEAFTDVARKHGYRIDEPIYDWVSDQFRGLIADPEFQAIVISNVRSQRELLRDYLNQEGFFNGDRVALVDIGWNGSSQRHFQQAFGDQDDYPHVYGLYLGWVHGIKHQFDPARNSIFGLLYDVRRNNRLEDGYSRFEEVFEEGGRALHASTLRYARDPETGKARPVFKDERAPDRVEEVRLNPKIARFHAGALDFAREFSRALTLTGYGFEDIRPHVATLVERLVSFPTREEAEFLMQLTHSEDFGYDNVLDLNRDRLSWRSLLRPRRLQERLRQSNWIYGSARLLRIPLLNSLIRYLDITRPRP